MPCLHERLHGVGLHEQRLVAHAHDLVAHLARRLRAGEPALADAAGDVAVRAAPWLPASPPRAPALAEQLRAMNAPLASRIAGAIVSTFSGSDSRTPFA
jgi:hypothetical protein